MFNEIATVLNFFLNTSVHRDIYLPLAGKNASVSVVPRDRRVVASSNMAWSIFRLAHPLYEKAFPIYRAFYSFYKGRCDRRERRLLSSLIEPGDTVVDVGANIGFYSSFFSRLVGPEGTVHAFEPDPVNYSHLQKAVGSMSNVRPCNAAVGEKSGKIQLWKHQTLNVDHRTFAVPGEQRIAIEVPIVTLDESFADQKLRLIKLDVQGSEASVLRGATRILTSSPRPAILFEFWPHALREAGENPLEFIEWIQQAASCRPKILTSRGLDEFDASTFPITNATWYCNLFLAGS